MENITSATMSVSGRSRRAATRNLVVCLSLLEKRRRVVSGTRFSIVRNMPLGRLLQITVGDAMGASSCQPCQSARTVDPLPASNIPPCRRLALGLPGAGQGCRDQNTTPYALRTGGIQPRFTDDKTDTGAQSQKEAQAPRPRIHRMRSSSAMTARNRIARL